MFVCLMEYDNSPMTRSAGGIIEPEARWSLCVKKNKYILFVVYRSSCLKWKARESIHFFVPYLIFSLSKNTNLTGTGISAGTETKTRIKKACQICILATV